MAKTLIPSPSFIGTTLPSISRHGHRRLVSTRVEFSFPEISPIHSVNFSYDFHQLASRAECILYTLANATVVADSGADAAATSSANMAALKNGGWFGFISDGMEFVLKVLKGGLDTLHVPYSYRFAIILLTVVVKVATLPLTKQQSRIQLETSRLYRQAGVNPLAGGFPTLATIAMWIGLYQALSNVTINGFFWIPSLDCPTTIASRQSGSGISWLFPFVDGHPPLDWQDTAAYLVLPVLLIVSQYVSMEIMKPPQTNDPAQKNTLLVFKFLPLMIGYFSLSVPSGLTIYRFTNNVLSTAQEVWLRKLGGAKPVVNENASGIITAGRAKRSISQPPRAGERFRHTKALPAEEVQSLSSAMDSDDGSAGEINDKVSVQQQEKLLSQVLNEGEEVPEEAYAPMGKKEVPNYSRSRSKRSKRKRAV